MLCVFKKILNLSWLGFPRNMRDTGEYLESVGRVDGVMLLNWKEKTLERQVSAFLELLR